MKHDEQSISNFLKSEDKIREFNPILRSLWYDGNGDWAKSHEQVDGLNGVDAARVHAYLHRKEGDQWNADYWYRKAGETCPDLTLEEEWLLLLNRFLK